MAWNGPKACGLSLFQVAVQLNCVEYGLLIMLTGFFWPICYIYLFFFLASIIDNRFFFLPQVVHAHHLHACLPWKRIFLFLCLENDFT